MKERRTGRTFEKLVDIMTLLRSEKGCPWDREQDEKSIVNFFLEEVYEAVDAVQSDDSQALKEELGDVLMEIVLLVELAKERGRFDVDDVLSGIIGKMIQRHPHVFGTREKGSSRSILEFWQKQKTTEKKRKSPFDGLAQSTPSLLQAYQIGQRAALVGFDWSRPEEVIKKLREEIGELEDELKKNDPGGVEEEIGDLLFSLANLARHLGLNPELVLRKANQKFKRRFLRLEEELRKRTRKRSRPGMAEMDRVWERIKKETL
jgi:tetrapyrrole methylase family protein/MazG family protein